MNLLAEDVAKLFIKSESHDENADRKGIASFSVRAPDSRLAHIDVMARLAGVSRNEMANHLLRLGIVAVLDATPESTCEEIREGVIDIIS